MKRKFESEWEKVEARIGKQRLLFIREMQLILAIRVQAEKDGKLDEFIENWIERPEMKTIWEDLDKNMRREMKLYLTEFTNDKLNSSMFVS